MRGLPTAPSHRLLLAAVALTAAATVVASLAGAGAFGGSELAPATVAAGCALIVAIGLVLHIPVPWGGVVPFGYALVVPLAASELPTGAQLTAAGLAVAIAVADTVARRDPGLPRVLALRMVLATAASIGAAAMADHLWPQAGTTGRAVAAALAVVAVDAVIAGFVGPVEHRIEVKTAIPVYLAVISAATLAAITLDQAGVLMAAVPVLPLLLARFSFQRYATANATLEQTVLALGFVPELVGLATVGQSERVALYADRVARTLGVDRRGRQRIVIASRLHRLGAVRFADDAAGDDPTDLPLDPSRMAAEGARILRHSGFPEEITQLVERAQAGSLDSTAPSLESSVIRIAVAFDAVVGNDVRRARLGLTRVELLAGDGHGRRATAALHQLVSQGETIVADAVAAGERFREKTDDLDLDRLFPTRPDRGIPMTSERPA